jgi:hypothetical protein
VHRRQLHLSGALSRLLSGVRPRRRAEDAVVKRLPSEFSRHACLMEQRHASDGLGALGRRPGLLVKVACCCEKVWDEGDNFEEHGGKACRACCEADCAVARRRRDAQPEHPNDW